MTLPSEKAIARRVKQHVNGMVRKFFAIVLPGFEATAKGELEEIGIQAVAEPVVGGVPFAGRLEDMYRANLAARTIARVLMRLDEFKVDGFARMGKKAVEIPWELYVADGASVAFRVDSTRSRLYHEGRIEEEFRAAIEARLAEYGRHVDFADGDQTVFVRLDVNRCVVSLDSSGGRLYQRGRRTFVAEASLRETLAASILRLAGWPGDYDELVDPMCGAGTLSLEALEMASGRLANAGREFAFRTWPAFRPAAFAHLAKHLEPPASPRPRRVVTSDVDPDAVATARKNLGDHPVEVRDFLAAAPLADDARRLYVLNPPYGKRLSGTNPRTLYRRIGDVIRGDPAASYAIIVPDLELEKVLSLPRDGKVVFRNGGLRVALIYRIHAAG